MLFARLTHSCLFELRFIYKVYLNTSLPTVAVPIQETDVTHMLHVHIRNLCRRKMERNQSKYVLLQSASSICSLFDYTHNGCLCYFTSYFCNVTFIQPGSPLRFVISLLRETRNLPPVCRLATSSPHAELRLVKMQHQHRKVFL